MKYALAAALLATIIGANWCLDTFGIWHIAGHPVPSGVLFAGLAFGLRDALHELAGRWPVVTVIAAGGVLSLAVAPDFAVASAGAFLVSELLDLVVYERLRERSWPWAVAVSNVAGAVADSAVFLWLAFGSLDFIAGQVAGKAVMVAVSIPLVWRARAVLAGHP